MTRRFRKPVWRRAGGRCEYCRLRQRQEPAIPFHVEHVLPRKHKGVTSLDNLALACYFCNLHKSSNFMGIDPQMRRPTRLFNPRRDDWVTHFRWKGAILIGVTPVGRATIEVLAMNHPDRIRLRKALLKNGDWPGE